MIQEQKEIVNLSLKSLFCNFDSFYKMLDKLRQCKIISLDSKCECFNTSLLFILKEERASQLIWKM